MLLGLCFRRNTFLKKTKSNNIQALKPVEQMGERQNTGFCFPGQMALSVYHVQSRFDSLGLRCWFRVVLQASLPAMWQMHITSKCHIDFLLSKLLKMFRSYLIGSCHSLSISSWSHGNHLRLKQNKTKRLSNLNPVVPSKSNRPVESMATFLLDVYGCINATMEVANWHSVGCMSLACLLVRLAQTRILLISHN